jgi:hypothetical protein
MFIGHYAVAFAARRYDRRTPLWLYFLAVQGLDLLWAPLVLAGFERVRIVPGITAASPLDLYYMPYSHGLPAALLWGALAAGIARRFARRSVGAPWLLGGAVFSHWLLDLIVHRPDLPLLGDQWKVGAGLWNHPPLSFGLEAALLALGVAIYLRAVRPTARRAAGVIGFALFMAAVQAAGMFIWRPHSSDQAVARSLIVTYLLYAALAGLIRDPAPAEPPGG